MIGRFYESKTKMNRKIVKLIHKGRYAAEVPVELIEDDTGRSPYLSLDDARKLDAVRLALRVGAIAEAAKHGRVFELTPILPDNRPKLRLTSSQCRIREGWSQLKHKAEQLFPPLSPPPKTTPDRRRTPALPGTRRFIRRAIWPQQPDVDRASNC